MIGSIHAMLAYSWENISNEIFASSAYAVIIPILIWINMDPKKIQGPKLKTVMLAYNTAACIFSLMSFLVITEAITRIPLYTEDCDIFFADPNVAWVSKLFHWSKYIEFLDTLFLILNGRSVGWLHYFHHIGAPLNLALGRYSRFEGIYIFVCLNGFIHTCMYGYYACMLCGGRCRKIVSKLKQVLTTMQIIQFVAGFILIVGYLQVECFRQDLGKITAYYYTWAYVGGVLAFFIVFYISKYVSKTVGASNDAVAKGKKAE